MSRLYLTSCLSRVWQHAVCGVAPLLSCQALLQAGARVNTVDYVQKQTPLHRLCDRGGGDTGGETLACLLEHGAAVNLQDRDGHTPLHIAAFRGQIELALALVSTGASPNVPSNEGLCALSRVPPTTVHGGKAVLAEVQQQMLARIAQPPPWLPDQLAPNCQLCGAVFSASNRRCNAPCTRWLPLTHFPHHHKLGPKSGRFPARRRRHHCRHCGRIACGDCSAHKSAIPKFGVSKPTRVCMDCAPVLHGKAGAALVIGSPWSRPPDTMAMVAHLDQQLAATAGPPPSPERNAPAFAAAASSPSCQVQQLVVDGPPSSAPQAAADSGGDPWALPLSMHGGLAGLVADTVNPRPTSTEIEERRLESLSPSGDEASTVNPFGASLPEGSSPTENGAISANPFGASIGAALASNPFGEADSPSTRTTLRNLSDAVFLSESPDPQSERRTP